MIPNRPPHRRIRRDLICSETGRLLHQISASGESGRMAQVLDGGRKSIPYNRLRRPAGRVGPARIVHTTRLHTEGWRDTRPTTIEEI